MLEKPKELTQDIVEKLGLVRKQKQNRGNYVNNLTLDEELIRAENILWKLPFSVIDNYSDWVICSMYLRKFGEDGKRLFIKWTTEKYLSIKPNSKRASDLDKKWDSFLQEREKIEIGTLYFYLKKHGKEE